MQCSGAGASPPAPKGPVEDPLEAIRRAAAQAGARPLPTGTCVLTAQAVRHAARGLVAMFPVELPILQAAAPAAPAAAPTGMSLPMAG